MTFSHFFSFIIDKNGLDFSLFAAEKGALFVLSLGWDRAYLHLCGFDIFSWLSKSFRQKNGVGKMQY